MQFSQYLGLFGNSVFENENIALNPIGLKEYDYYDLDNSLDEIEEDLYSENFYGDYDDTFVPPPVVPLKETSNPFGIDINFDDYKLSDIRNVEYEYDYDDYEEEKEEDKIVKSPFGGDININDYKLSDVKDKEYEYDYEDEEDEKINEINVDDKIMSTAVRKPQISYKYKIIKNIPQTFIPHRYVIRGPHHVTPPARPHRPHYRRPYVRPHRPRPRPQPQRPRDPFTAFAVNIRKKVDSIFKAVTKKFNFPGRI